VPLLPSVQASRLGEKVGTASVRTWRSMIPLPKELAKGSDKYRRDQRLLTRESESIVTIAVISSEKALAIFSIETATRLPDSDAAGSILR
jgi:hypothetical protein